MKIPTMLLAFALISAAMAAATAAPVDDSQALLQALDEVAQLVQSDDKVQQADAAAEESEKEAVDGDGMMTDGVIDVMPGTDFDPEELEDVVKQLKEKLSLEKS